MWPLFLIICVATASAGQNPPAATDNQKFDAHFAVFMKPTAFLDQLVPRVLTLTQSTLRP